MPVVLSEIPCVSDVSSLQLKSIFRKQNLGNGFRFSNWLEFTRKALPVFDIVLRRYPDH